ncbi:MAG: glucose-6-phosphate dehydrogenase [Sedimentisphaerales bacterium]|nr:glucose-6-phosphate dehydrogenase [Sedimentisphaerales bacterium]
MREIKPTINKREILCAEAVPGPTALVVFGASGDLFGRKLLMSIFQLSMRDLLDDRFYLLGCGRKKCSDQDFRKNTEQLIREKSENISPDKLEAFVNKLYYIDGDYNDTQFYEKIKARIAELDKTHKVYESLIYYLSVPPFLYPVIIEHLAPAGLSCTKRLKSKQSIKLVIEKPFGRDLESAVELNDKIHMCFNESQIYRIDHYLGKETVQNILMFRFANTIFEPVWNRNYIDHVQITIAESTGVEHRASYYDKSGALRDMFQNHILQMLALVAMESPISFEGDHIRDEIVKLLRSIRPVDINRLNELCVRGQYTSGQINGSKINSYQEEPGVKENSQTETYVAAKMFVDNWRWKGVPFYLRTGKRMAVKETEIAITFKQVPYSMFSSVGLDELPANVLVMRIQPKEGISLSFQAKRPGAKTCISTLTMNFNYNELFGTEPPEAYQRLLLDCMVNDQTLFTRQDAIETTWRLLMPVLQAWENDSCELYKYPAGEESFAAADKLIESDGRKWRPLLNK